MIKRISAIAIILLLSFLSAPQTYAAPNSEDAAATESYTSDSSDKEVSVRDIYHEIGPSETLWRISSIYGVDMATIMRANNLTSKTELKKGMKLLIPQTRGPRANIPLFPTTRWKSIVIHHSRTGEGNAYTLDKQQLERGDENGLAEHFVIDNGTRGKVMGQIEAGPRWLKQMDSGICQLSEKKSDAETISIVLIGNYNETGLPDKQLDSLVFLTVTLATFYHIKPENILQHDEMCPGTNFQWKEFRRRVGSYVSASSENQPSPSSGAAATTTTQTVQPFLGYQYKNIKWVSHVPILPAGDKSNPEPDEADYRGQEDVGRVDLFGNGKYETIKAIWGIGVTDHSLKIEVYEGDKVVATLEPKGIQPNFKVEDIDGDGKLEIVLWGAVADPAMSQDVSDESKPFEGHSEPHLFTVSIYKPVGTNFELAREYTSKKKYEPFCEEQPE